MHVACGSVCLIYEYCVAVFAMMCMCRVALVAKFLVFLCACRI